MGDMSFAGRLFEYTYSSWLRADVFQGIEMNDEHGFTSVLYFEFPTVKTRQ